MDRDITAIERVHRSMSSSLLWLSLLFFFLMFSFFTGLDSGYQLAKVILSVTIMTGLMSIYFGFSRRRIWAYKLAMAHWIFLILICSFIGVIDLLAGIQGDILALVMAAMLFFIAIGMVNRFSTFSNPLFMAWYLGQANQMLATSKLEGNEMMGACPNCLSLLAVKPLELSKEDKCPNCGENLVSDETYKKFPFEEE